MRRVWLICCVLLAAISPAGAQLRIATWNVTTYSNTLPSPRDAAFKTALYTEYQGRTLAPDVLVGQEFTSAAAVTAFRTALNTAPSSPSDWVAAPFVLGPDTNNALFYRTSKVVLVDVTTISLGGASPAPPRNTERYDLRPVGYGPATTIAVYSSHMKSGGASTDLARRLVEAQRIRAAAAALDPAWSFIVAGDFNIPSSSQAAFQALVAPPTAGQVLDPIATPGNWNNNPAFRFVHTQSPGGIATQTGGMDDRFDHLLLSAALLDGAGMDYIGLAGVPYSTTTWNDPNHSYRAWGNDGTSYNAALTVATNQMVGPTIAQALVTSTNADIFGGHLPVYLDLRVPAKVGAPLLLDFGTVPWGRPVQVPLQVANAANLQLWSAAGIATLRYTLAVTPGFSAPPGPFAAAPGASGQHALTMLTQTPGPAGGTLTIHSDDPDSPQRIVQLAGFVCYADCDADGLLSLADFGCFQTRFSLSHPYADCNRDGLWDLADFGCFQTHFATGCP